MLKLIANKSFVGSCRFIRQFATQAINQNPIDDLEKKRKVLELEVELFRQEGRKVPSQLSPSEWDRLMILPSVSARRKYYSFLFGCEMTKINLKAKKEERLKERQIMIDKLKEEEKDKHIVYGLGRNSIHLRLYDSTINLWNNNKLINAIMFSQKLVIDCSYDQYMTMREADNCAKQLSLCFATNRLHDQPFDLQLCNFNPNSVSGKKLLNHIPTLLNPDFPMSVHQDSYLEHFDKKKLVYLTPHCRETLDYNHDDVYIVGAMVDKATNEAYSLAKAKKLGLRMAKFPLDHYMRFKGGKSLTINQVVEILLTMRITNNWEQTLLKHIPRRKIAGVYSPIYSQDNDDDIDESFVNKFSNRMNYKGNNYNDGKKHSFTVSKSYDKNKRANIRSIFNDE